MSLILRTAQQYRSDVLAFHADASAVAIRAWGQSQSAIERELERVLARAQELRDTGLPPTQSTLWRIERLERLLLQVQEQAEVLSRLSQSQTISAQEQLVSLAGEHAQRLLEIGVENSDAVSGWTFSRLPDEALTHLVGTLQDGSPLAELFEGFGQEARQRAEQTLIEQLTLGNNPREAARAFRDATSQTLERSLLISRTEMLRSYRLATHQNYLNNHDIMEGWRWCCALSPRTCPVCWSAHGSIHPITQPLTSHPACRCTSVPMVTGDDTPFDDGDAEFARLPEAQQREILGPRRHERYASGTPISQMIEWRPNARWGGSYQLIPLSRLP